MGQPNDDAARVNAVISERIRKLRQSRRWTLEQLASLSQVSRSMLSQIERGIANPTLGVAHRIAQALGVTLAELVDSAVERPQLDVIRGQDDRYLFRDDDTCRIRTLSPLDLEKDIEFYEVTLHPKGKLESAAHFAGTRELVAVQKGSVEVESGNTCERLHAGDSAHYRADMPHALRNTGRGEARLFLVVTYAG